MTDLSTKEILTEHFTYKDVVINGNKYIVGVCKKNDVRQVVLTNLIDFYEENLTKKNIIERCEELNPVLIDYNFEDIVDEILVNIPKYVESCTTDCIKLESKIEDGCFWFNINLTKSISNSFHDNFIQSFYFSVAELHHRYQCLLDIVKRKDAEIDEYKAEGVELLRKSIVTEPFTEELFETKLKNTISKDNVNIFLDIMNFYSSIKGLNLDKVKQEAINSEPASIVNTDNLGSNLTKRPSSSVVRCAVAPKAVKKLKASDDNSKFQFL